MRYTPNIHEHQGGRITPPPMWALQPAYSVLPLIRWPLGYDVVYPVRMLAIAVMLAVLGFLLAAAYPPARDGSFCFFTFLVLMFARACSMFARRAIGQRRGEEIHTKEAGYSFVTRLLRFLPVGVTEQLLTPALLCWVGWLIATAQVVEERGRLIPVSFLFGWWLVAAGVSYLLMARWEYRMRWAQHREPVNQMIRAKLFEARLGAHEQARSRNGAARGETSAGNTDPGFEPDIAELGGKAGWFR